MTGEKPTYEPKETGRDVDPATGFSIVRYDNPEGDALMEASIEENKRIRTSGVRAFAVGGVSVAGASGGKINKHGTNYN